MENMHSSHVIKCPYCDKEYFPSEIFVPKYFIGTANHITSDICLGNDMELFETYICDKCNNVFEVNAEVNFTTKRTIFGNFDKEFIQK